MSLSSIQSSLDSLNRELIQLQRYLQDNTKKIEEKFKEIERIQRSLSSSTISLSTLKSKNSELERCQKSISEFQKKGKDLDKKIADKKAQIARKNAEFQAEQRKQIEQVTKLEQEEQRRQRDNNIQIQKQIQSMRTPGVRIFQDFLHHSPNNAIIRMSIPIGVQPDSKEEIEEEQPRYDFFISHASEDKENVAKPLYTFLTEKGAKVWYDDFTLMVGDHLRKSIDKGLISSRFGIVIFSEYFFINKSWPEYELDGLIQKQMKEKKVILPIWHNISLDTVRKYSPSLTDIVALKTSDLSIEEIAMKLMQLLN